MSRYLLDTHKFIWMFNGDRSLLGADALTALLDNQSDAYLSLVSVWEMSIKISIGKLRLAAPLHEVVATQTAAAGIMILPIIADDLYSLENLPHHHRDPFDRLLAVQAMNHDLSLLSRDIAFDAYGVSRVW